MQIYESTLLTFTNLYFSLSVFLANVASSIVIEARHTSFSEVDTDHNIVQQHIWNVMSHYMLIVKHQIHRYPFLHARVRGILYLRYTFFDAYHPILSYSLSPIIF